MPRSALVPGQPILERFAALRVWERGSQRAPHKPLLVLYALGRLARGDTGPVFFTDLEDCLGRLLRDFGPPRKAIHPEYPFWRLQNDGLWTVHALREMRSRASNTDPPRSELRAAGASGSFVPEILAALTRDPGLIFAAAELLLDAHFPASYHQAILTAVDLRLVTDDVALIPKRRPRDPEFRQRILTTYGWRCAVCELDARVGQLSFALEAAHLMWHHAGGPDVEHNGLALCALHHIALDFGVSSRICRGGCNHAAFLSRA